MPLRVELVPVPEAGTGPTPLIEGFVQLWQRWHLDLYGHDDLNEAAGPMATAYAEQDYRTKLMTVALDGDRVVGATYSGLPLRDNTTIAECDIGVDPQADLETVGQALWDDLRDRLLREGRRTAQVWSTHRLPEHSGDLDWVVPATGVGRVPLDSTARQLQGWGFRLEQVERHSSLDVAAATARLADLETQALRHAEPDYETLSWAGVTPVELRAGMADLCARMSIDVPSGELDLEAEDWDAERVAASDRVAERMGRRRITTVARHRASGVLAAYTQIDQPTEHPAVAYQEDTLVHGEHRGHRLGLLVKVRNLHALAEQASSVRRVHTWNADENAHMLRINLALGFTEASIVGGWQARL